MLLEIISYTIIGIFVSPFVFSLCHTGQPDRREEYELYDRRNEYGHYSRCRYCGRHHGGF